MTHKAFLKDALIEILSVFQFCILIFSYYVFKFFNKKESGVVVGVTEISKLLYLYGHVIPNAVTVCLSENKLYELKYRFKISNKNRLTYLFKKLLFAPVLLGYLSNRYDTFIYLWSTGFILNRKYDYYFLNKRSKKIVSIFVGDDIRSPIKLRKILQDIQEDGFIEPYGKQNPYYLSNSYDNKKIRIAKLSDKYSDVHFSYPIDQASYLERKQYPTPYIYLKKDLYFSEKKFLNVKKYKLIHAPSNTFIKGTNFVRKAINSLRDQGYDFEYKELKNVDNKTLIQELRTSHIVLNQFYAFVPGMLGIEAMASHCAVLMSADPRIEKNLPQYEKTPWMITKTTEIYHNIKYLFDNQLEIKGFADSGYYFVRDNFTEEPVRKYFIETLKKNGVKI